MANKKITDLTDIDNSLAMSAQVEIAQSGSFRSTLTKILTLFRANADSTESAKGFIELATQTEVNTGTDAVRAVTPSTLKNSTQWATKISVGVHTNTAAGGSEVNLDGNSGVAVFEDNITHNQTAQFIINNEAARTTSMWMFSMNYSGAGFPVILHHTTGDGLVTIHVGNLNINGGTDNTDENISINFILLNP